MRGSSPGLYKQSVVSRQLQKEEDYWTNQLTGEWIRSAFPYDRKKIQTSWCCKLESVKFRLTGDLFAKLMKLSNGSDYRLHMIMVAGLEVLLNKYTANTDIIVGTPILKQDVEAEFINTALALRNLVDNNDMSFKELLLQVRETITEANENQNYPIEQLPQRLNIPFSQADDFPLFDMAILLENIQDKAYIQHIHTNMIFIFYRASEAIEGIVEYNSLLYDKISIERLYSHFIHLLEGVVFNVNLKIKDIDLLAQEEKKQLLSDFSNTRADYPDDKTIHQLFAEQVKKAPGHTALVLDDKKLTYRALNERANRLAGVLREKGVKPDTIAGIMLQSSIELIIGIMAVLKSDAAYLPLDPDYPEERINYMLKDSSAKILVTSPGLSEKFGKLLIVNCQLLMVNEKPTASSHLHLSRRYAPVTSLAYIIYTSGSSGRPKGVMVEHRSGVNTLLYRKEEYKMDSKVVSLQLFSHAFDGFVTSFFTPIISGAKVILLSDEQISDITKIKEAIVKNKITHFICVPTLYRAVLEWISPQETSSLKIVTLAGETLSLDLLEVTTAKNKNIEIVNEYGITEAAVLSTLYRHQEKANKLSIGKPIRNSKIYILNEWGQLQLVGVPGELCISGTGVARGYLNQPELTAEKFVEQVTSAGDRCRWKNKSFCGGPGGSFFKKSPLAAGGKRIYKTGDLGRWLPDGNIEFLGRRDHQVKIRGFRIELGEIEGKLSNHKKIKEAVVTLKEKENGDKYLCAYIVGKDGPAVEKMPGSTELREYLAMELPDYMMPLYYVNLEKIPLNANGKIDRKALPEPKGISLDSNEEYIPPRNPVEKELVEVWERVLGRNNIGINENFFMIGGDSIKSIQILSGMNKAGYKVEMRELFQNPTISQLALKVKKMERIPAQSPVTGALPLTPIQEWFCRGTSIDPHHFNQGVMIYSSQGFDEEAIKAVFKKIQEHHDALRMTYKSENGKILQTNHGLDYPFSLQVYDCRNQVSEDAAAALEAKANEIQASIYLEHGPLMKLGLFRLDDGDRLLMVIHHLVIDGVSWRILFEDIEHLMQQYKNGEPLVLPLKTDSFKAWSEKLSQYADSPTFLKEKRYWVELESSVVSKIEKDFEKEDNFRTDTEALSFHLNEEETNHLLTKVNEAFATEINDILLTALGLAIRKTWGHNRVLIGLEGHGREDIFDDMDTSRTMGWFTSAYPVLLDVCYERDLGRQVKEIKETLRKVPNKGIGYGILRYLTSQHHKKEMDFKLKPQVVFNYLGQFDADVEQKSFKIAKESPGNAMSPKGKRECEFDVSGLISNNRLVMTIVYNKKQYKSETIEALLAHFQSQLKHIIAYCSAKENRELTPSDFTYKHLSIETVDQLNLQYQYMIEDLYKLTPMQEGMLFHALYDNSSASYFEQTSYRLHGNLDVTIVKKSLNELVKRQDILRTAFVHEGLDHPVQVVLQDRQIDFYYQDISQMAEAKDKEIFIKEFKEKDIQRCFDLSKDVLMRISILRADRSECELTWSFHHILMDGWCIGILNSEFFEIYNSFLQHRPFQLPGIKPYRTYIQWLEKQDKQASKRYWQEYLDAYQEVAAVPKMKMREIEKEIGEKVYKHEQVSVTLDRETTGSLSRIAGKNHVTLNIITQTLWGIVLGKYNGRNDVVFGAVVSGRPFELEGVESMVGLFINTIPVRIRFEEKTKFNHLLQIVLQEAIASEPHHYHPLAEIQSQSILKQDLIHHLFIFENYPVAARIQGYENKRNQSNNGVKFALSNIDVFEQTNYDFNVVVGLGDQLSIKFIYNGNTYDGDFVEKIACHFNRLVNQIIVNEESEIEELTLISSEEKKQVLYDFNNTEAEYPKEKPLHQFFEEQAARTPNRAALIGINAKFQIQNYKLQTNKAPSRQVNSFGKNILITYKELNKRSDQLACLLIETGAQPDTIVGIMFERSPEMIIGILAILKAGGAYMPIDPEYPEERKQYMLADSGAKVLVTTSSLAKADENVKRYDGKNNLEIVLFDFSTLLPQQPSTLPFPHLNLSPWINAPATSLAYILYTSGSTGKPKGVAVEHLSAVNILMALQQEYPFTPSDTYLLKTSYTFDVSVTELFGWYLGGGRLAIMETNGDKDPKAIMDTIERLGALILILSPPC